MNVLDKASGDHYLPRFVAFSTTATFSTAAQARLVMDRARGARALVS
jgi:hypothetical protein